MARRNLNHKMLDNVDISTSQTQSSESNVENVDQAFVIIKWTGTAPVGAITFEGSNDNLNEIKKGTEVWEELYMGLVPIDVTGNSGSHHIQFNSMPFKWLRIKYTSTSGIGNLTAHINAASLGA